MVVAAFDDTLVRNQDSGQRHLTLELGAVYSRKHSVGGSGGNKPNRSAKAQTWITETM
jgi:hypothetical protein